MAVNISKQPQSSTASQAPARALPKPALDPMSPMLTQPTRGLVERGIISEVSVTFSPMGTSVYGKASAVLCAVKDSGLNQTDKFPVARLIELAEKGELFTRPGKKNKGTGGPAQAKPARSLCVEDLDGTLDPAGLQNRINSIAKACGGGPLVGRVRSAKKFDGDETISYQQWWEDSDPSLRALSLSEGKRYASFTKDQIGKLAKLQCPFRGTLEFTVAEEDDK